MRFPPGALIKHNKGKMRIKETINIKQIETWPTRYIDEDQAEKLINKITDAEFLFNSFNVNYHECGSHQLAVTGDLVFDTDNLKLIVELADCLYQLQNMETK